MTLWMVDWRQPLKKRARKTVVIRYVVMNETLEGALDLVRSHVDRRGGTLSGRSMSKDAVVMVNSFSSDPTTAELSLQKGYG